VVGRAGAISRGYPWRVNLLVHGRGDSDRDEGEIERFVDLGSVKYRECGVNVCGYV